MKASVTITQHGIALVVDLAVSDDDYDVIGVHFPSAVLGKPESVDVSAWIDHEAPDSWDSIRDAAIIAYEDQCQARKQDHLYELFKEAV